MDVVFFHVFAHIEAAAHLAGVALAADVFAFFVLLVAVNILLCGDSQITVLEFNRDVILLHTRKINSDFVTLVCLLYVRLHLTCSFTAVELLIHPGHIRKCRHVEIIIKPVIKKIIIHNSRHKHKSSLLSHLSFFGIATYDIVRGARELATRGARATP